MINKKKARLRRAVKSRAQMRIQAVHRLCVCRTPKHIYAQVIAPDGARTLVAAASVEKDVALDMKGKSKISTAIEVGKLIAQRALGKGIAELAFDRSGYKYHGRVKALAEAAREQGLQF